jgi:hypothetical protein
MFTIHRNDVERPKKKMSKAWILIDLLSKVKILFYSIYVLLEFNCISSNSTSQVFTIDGCWVSKPPDLTRRLLVFELFSWRVFS